jgi:hypothetical protein
MFDNLREELFNLRLRVEELERNGGQSFTDKFGDGGS